MKIISLGQAGFLVESEKKRFLIDPYLSNYVVSSGEGDAVLFKREFSAPINISQMKGIDAIFVTHDHADHCDPETILPILAQNLGCKVFGPQPVIDHLIREGVSLSSLHLAPVFITMTIGSLFCTSVPSAHYELAQDPITGEFPNLGFVIHCDGKVLYHSGDTILYDGMVEIIKSISNRFDICLLPVNGRDERREALGIIGNLTPVEALELADGLKTTRLIPMHNDLFKINQIEPQILDTLAKEKFPELLVNWLKPGEELIF